nr:hypothetical protein [Maritimibacter sp. DP1N21-5]
MEPVDGFEQHGIFPALRAHIIGDRRIMHHFIVKGGHQFENRSALLRQTRTDRFEFIQELVQHLVDERPAIREVPKKCRSSNAGTLCNGIERRTHTAFEKNLVCRIQDPQPVLVEIGASFRHVYPISLSEYVPPLSQKQKGKLSPLTAVTHLYHKLTE